MPLLFKLVTPAHADACGSIHQNGDDAGRFRRTGGRSHRAARAEVLVVRAAR